MICRAHQKAWIFGLGSARRGLGNRSKHCLASRPYHKSHGFLRLVKLTLRCGGSHVCEMHPLSERSACYAVELSQTHSLFFAAHTCRAFWPLRTRMLQDEVNQIGMALKAGTMTPDEINRDDAISLRLERMRAAGTSQRGKFVRTSTNDIMAKTFDPIKWVVPGYISEGFLVLAGRQKLGKTWLAVDMALAVATGTAAIGSIICEQGDVLSFA